MNWGNIRAVIAGAVSQCTGIRPENCVWASGIQASAFTVDTRATLSATSIRSIGVDETLTEAPNGLDEVTVTMCGNRAFTLTVRIASQNQADAATARELIDKLRIRMRRVSIREQFTAAGLAIQSFGATMQYDSLAGGRVVTISAMDIFMLGVDVDTDTTIGAGDWIGEAIVDGNTLNDAAGPVSPQPHIDVDARS